VILPQIEIVLDEYLPLIGRDGRLVHSRSPLIGWALMIGGAGLWATVVFADVVHDMLLHFLWGDIVFAAGALELARRRGAYERPWLDWVLPLAFVGCGALFIVHVEIDPGGQGAHWHLAIALLLVAAGLLELARLRWLRAAAIPLGLLPLAASALALIAIPVAAAS
jgi:hypothetical protein